MGLIPPQPTPSADTVTRRYTSIPYTFPYTQMFHTCFSIPHAFPHMPLGNVVYMNSIRSSVSGVIFVNVQLILPAAYLYIMNYAVF